MRSRGARTHGGPLRLWGDETTLALGLALGRGSNDSYGSRYQAITTGAFGALAYREAMGTRFVGVVLGWTFVGSI